MQAIVVHKYGIPGKEPKKWVCERLRLVPWKYIIDPAQAYKEAAMYHKLS